MAATCTAAWTRAPRQEQAAEIPIVLFPSVVFPGATVQLQAFEFRYRTMVHTRLQVRRRVLRRAAAPRRSGRRGGGRRGGVRRRRPVPRRRRRQDEAVRGREDPPRRRKPVAAPHSAPLYHPTEASSSAAMADRGSRGEVYREEKEIALCNCKFNCRKYFSLQKMMRLNLVEGGSHSTQCC
ncbi:hypothetical protein DAI22_03g243600 [Oryza sativa Japonica Group]|nr:hypothetical protein DAI22_03g243600 [Oryza sativa Japonica Group]